MPTIDALIIIANGSAADLPSTAEGIAAALNVPVGDVRSGIPFFCKDIPTARCSTGSGSVSDQLNDFIAAQHQTNIHLAESMTRCQTLLEENSRRLFGGDGQPGALPKLYDKIETVETRTGSLEGWKKSSVAWIAGAAAILALEGSAFALYFQHIAGKLSH